MIRKGTTQIKILLVTLLLLIMLPGNTLQAAKDKIKPVISSVKVTIGLDKNVQVNFVLSEQSKVTINVYQGNKIVKNGLNKSLKKKGSVKWVWPADKYSGNYTVKISAIDMAGNVSETKIAHFKIAANPSNDDLNTKGTYNRDFNLIKPATTYGPKEGSTIVNGNITIKANNITLKNLTVNGVLTIDPGADGDAVLDNITAQKVVVLSGAPNSIKIIKVKVPFFEIKNDNDVRIVISAGTAIDQTTVESGAALQTEGDASFGIVDIKTHKQMVKLDGTFNQVIVDGTDSKLFATSGSKIAIVKITTPIELAGDFSHSLISIDAANIMIKVAPSTQVKEIEVNAKATITADTTASIILVDVKADVRLEGTITGTVNIAVSNITLTIEHGSKVETIIRDTGVSDITQIVEGPPSNYVPSDPVPNYPPPAPPSPTVSWSITPTTGDSSISVLRISNIANFTSTPTHFGLYNHNGQIIETIKAVSEEITTSSSSFATTSNFTVKFFKDSAGTTLLGTANLSTAALNNGAGNGTIIITPVKANWSVSKPFNESITSNFTVNGLTGLSGTLYYQLFTTNDQAVTDKLSTSTSFGTVSVMFSIPNNLKIKFYSSNAVDAEPIAQGSLTGTVSNGTGSGAINF